MTPSAPVRLRREAPIAALLAACVAAVALWNALWFAPTHTLGAWDWLSSACSLTRVDPAPNVVHTEILDPVRQMVPWALTAREQLAQGEAPLWSRFNGGGPLLANYQSALLSPFTWPFYVLPLGAALLVSTFSKLFVLAFGMFLFLRELRLSRIAAAAGAVAFGTAGFNLMCMLHPHVGVLACLPPALTAIERAAQRRRERPAELPIAALAALALLLGVMTLAGHPETLLFCLYVVVAFSLLRVVQSGLGGPGFDARSAAGFGAAFVLAGLAGAAIGAVQLAPFLELFRASPLAHEAGRRIARFSPFHALLLFYPDAAGHPTSGSTAGPMLAANYQEVNSLHIGGLIAALTLAAPLVLRRNATGWFFFALGLLAAVSVFDLAWLNSLDEALFFSDHLPSTRVNPLWMVGACVCAALVIDSAFKGRTTGSCARSNLIVGLVAFVLIGARLALSSWWNSIGESGAAAVDAIRAVAAERSNTLLTLALAGLLGLTLLRAARTRGHRAGAALLLLTSVAAQGVFVFGDFMPIVEDRYVLPNTPALEQFHARASGDRVVFLTADSPPVNANALYDVELLSSYEILEERRWSRLREELLGVTSHMSGTMFASRRALDLFGVRDVVTRGEWLPIDTENCSGALDTQSRWVFMSEFGVPAKPRYATLDADRPQLSQRLHASRDDFHALALVFHDAPSSRDEALELVLADASGGAVLARRNVTLASMRALPHERRECVFAFEAIANSSGREFELSVTLLQPSPTSKVELLRAGKLSAAVSGEGVRDEDTSEKTRGGRARVVFDLAYADDAFGEPQPIGPLLLRRYQAGRGAAWLVSRSRAASDEEQAHEFVLSDAFDPREEVVLETANSIDHGGAARELIVESSGGAHARYRTRCAAPGFLVLAQPRLPGWSASIDGLDVEVLRANFAFCALEIPEGEHVVAVDYAPRSVRWGAITSLLAFVGALVAGLFALRRAG